MTERPPAITGKQLIKLLIKDGWVESGGKGSHISLRKAYSDRTRITVIKNTNDSIPAGTLSAILGPKQAQLGKAGLLALIKKYGI
jgi:predicted RNA binding protein YcfA (HicA-like mRNA interferase family)